MFANYCLSNFLITAHVLKFGQNFLYILNGFIKNLSHIREFFSEHTRGGVIAITTDLVNL